MRRSAPSVSTVTQKNTRGRVFWSSLAAGSTALALALTAAGPVSATETLSIDFNGAGYSVAPQSPIGQNTWFGSPLGPGGTTVDMSLADNSSFPLAGLPAGGRSLRFSNAVRGSSNGQLVSPLIEPAGETATGAPNNVFDATFIVASATGALQEGLNVDVNIDGSSRYGGVLNLHHTAAGLEIGSYWMAPGTTEWRSAVLATVPATVPHSIRLVATFVDDAPDLLDIYVDGSLVSAGTGVTTWEGYHASVSPSAVPQSVDSLSFKSGNSAPTATGVGFDSIPAQPATAGFGYLFSGIGYASYVAVPQTEPTLPPAADPSPDVTLPAQQGEHGDTITVTIPDGTFAPYENVYVTWYSTPVFGGWFQANAAGGLTATLTVPAGLAAGAHTLQFTGASGLVVSAAFLVIALAETGAEPAVPLAAGALLLLLGLGLIAIRRSTRVAAAQR